MGSTSSSIKVEEYRQAYQDIKNMQEGTNNLLQHQAEELKGLHQKLEIMHKDNQTVWTQFKQMEKNFLDQKIRQVSSQTKMFQDLATIKTGVEDLQCTDIAPSKQICSILAHTLRKIEDTKDMEREIMEKISNLQSNVDVLSNSQMNSDMERKKTEISLNKQLKNLEKKLIELQSSGSEPRQEFMGKLSMDNEEEPPCDHSSESDGKRARRDSNKLPEYTKVSRSKLQDGDSSASTKKREQSKPHSGGHFEASDEKPLPKDFILKLHNFSKLEGSNRFFFTDKYLFENLGGYFKGHVSFTKDKNLVFSLLFEPGDIRQELLNEESRFVHTMRILSSGPGGKDRIINADKKSLKELRMSQWGKFNGFQLCTTSCDSVKEYLSNDGREELQVKFRVRLC